MVASLSVSIHGPPYQVRLTRYHSLQQPSNLFDFVEDPPTNFSLTLGQGTQRLLPAVSLLLPSLRPL